MSNYYIQYNQVLAQEFGQPNEISAIQNTQENNIQPVRNIKSQNIKFQNLDQMIQTQFQQSCSHASIQDQSQNENPSEEQQNQEYIKTIQENLEEQIYINSENLQFDQFYGLNIKSVINELEPIRVQSPQNQSQYQHRSQEIFSLDIETKMEDSFDYIDLFLNVDRINETCCAQQQPLIQDCSSQWILEEKILEEEIAFMLQNCQFNKHQELKPQKHSPFSKSQESDITDLFTPNTHDLETLSSLELQKNNFQVQGSVSWEQNKSDSLLENLGIEEKNKNQTDVFFCQEKYNGKSEDFKLAQLFEQNVAESSQQKQMHLEIIEKQLDQSSKNIKNIRCDQQLVLLESSQQIPKKRASQYVLKKNPKKESGRNNSNLTFDSDNTQSSTTYSSVTTKQLKNKKKRRGEERRFMKSEEALKILQAAYENNSNWSKAKIAQLSQLTNLSQSQVYKWNWDRKIFKNQMIIRNMIEKNVYFGKIFEVQKPNSDIEGYKIFRIDKMEKS